MDRYGEYNIKVTVLKELFVTSMWWRKPTTLDITVSEYEVHKVLTMKGDELSHVLKRRLLCQSNYYFYDDCDQDYLSKCLVIIKDYNNVTCFKKIYNQVDNLNRRFFTNQQV